MMIKEYKASVQLNNELTVVYFEAKGNPIEHLWAHYGISTYIEYIEEIVKEAEPESEKETIEDIEEFSEEVEPEEITE